MIAMILVIIIFIFILFIMGVKNIFIRLFVRIFINNGVINANTIKNIDVYIKDFPVFFRSFVIIVNNIKNVMVSNISIIL